MRRQTKQTTKMRLTLAFTVYVSVSNTCKIYITTRQISFNHNNMIEYDWFQTLPNGHHRSSYFSHIYSIIFRQFVFDQLSTYPSQPCCFFKHCYALLLNLLYTVFIIHLFYYLLWDFKMHIFFIILRQINWTSSPFYMPLLFAVYSAFLNFISKLPLPTHLKDNFF